MRKTKKKKSQKIEKRFVANRTKTNLSSRRLRRAMRMMQDARKMKSHARAVLKMLKENKAVYSPPPPVADEVK